MHASIHTALVSVVFAAALPNMSSAEVITAEAIETANYAGGALPAGQSALTVKVQTLLDRAGTSPGVIDGVNGGMSRSAIAAFERRSGLPADGQMDPQVWAALQPFENSAITTYYTVTEADVTGLTKFIPTDYLEKANMTSLGYTSVVEKLGERFHMDEKFVSVLNPGVPMVAGSTIKVIAPSKPIRTKVTRIYVEKGTNRVSAYDAKGRMVVNYPATIGSTETPSPSGTHTVRAVALNPEYTYNPAINFTQGENKTVLTLPPGPNGPVGTVWIALSKPTYGIHGTPTPSQLFVNQSRGCVRLTNWDAQELAHMVQRGVTTVQFLEKGTTIAVATGDAANTLSHVTEQGSKADNVGVASLNLASSLPPLSKPVRLASQPDAPVAESFQGSAPVNNIPSPVPAVTEPPVTNAPDITPAGTSVDPLTKAVQDAISNVEHKATGARPLAEVTETPEEEKKVTAPAAATPLRDSVGPDR